MDRTAKKLLIGVSLALIILTSSPYFYGWLMRPSNTIFMGNGFFNAHDNFVYYAYIEQIKSGHWLNWDAFTAEPQQPFFNWFWLLAGLLARGAHLGPMAIFHLLRILLIPFFVLTVFCFITSAYQNRAESQRLTRWAIVLLFFTSSASAYLSFGQSWQFPLEGLWPEAYAFFSAMASPHFIASWILMIWSFWFLARGVEQNRLRPILWSGLLGAALGQFHAFYLALLGPVSLIFFLCQKKLKPKRRLIMAGLYFLPLIPIALYYFLLISGDSVMRGRFFDGAMQTPLNLWLIFLAFGLLLPLAIANLCRGDWSKQTALEELAGIWTLTVPLLLFMPSPFQRRLIEGWQLPVVILAAPLALQLAEAIDKNIKIAGKYYCSALFCLFFFISPWRVWISTLAIYHQPEGRNLYYPQSDWQALSWLKKYDPTPAIILSSAYTGQVAALAADKIAFVGHSRETLQAQAKRIQFIRLIQKSTADHDRQQFLKQQGSRYLFWGSYEKKMGDFQPETKNYLEKIYDVNDVTIYRVDL